VWLVTVVRTTSTRGQVTRARRLVALAAFQSDRYRNFISFYEANKVKGRRIGRAVEELDAPVNRFVCHVDFVSKLAEGRVEPEERVDLKQPLPEYHFQ